MESLVCWCSEEWQQLITIFQLELIVLKYFVIIPNPGKLFKIISGKYVGGIIPFRGGGCADDDIHRCSMTVKCRCRLSNFPFSGFYFSMVVSGIYLDGR